VEVWQTSNRRWLRLGEEKKEEETRGQKYNGVPYYNHQQQVRVRVRYLYPFEICSTVSALGCWTPSDVTAAFSVVAASARTSRRDVLVAVVLSVVAELVTDDDAVVLDTDAAFVEMDAALDVAGLSCIQQARHVHVRLFWFSGRSSVLGRRAFAVLRSACS